MTLTERLRTRAAIRRSIPHRKSVQEGQEDRLAALLEEAADEIERLSRFKSYVHGWLDEQGVNPCVEEGKSGCRIAARLKCVENMIWKR